VNPWFAKAVIIAATAAMVLIRAPHGRRSRMIGVVQNRKGWLDSCLLILAWLTFLLPLAWIVSPVFSSADYQLRPTNFVVGTVGLAVGLWLFYESHAALGRNWSVTLEIRDRHQLVTHGVYEVVRHPMYLSLLVYSAGQMLVLPNWVAGPAYGLAILLIVAFRIGPEERMMQEAFGKDYEAYKAQTKRLIPGVW
jgi:protein-S-isoprenylcysteine O-methyltransferase Ste14